MITVRTNISDAIRYFDSLAVDMESAMDLAMEEALNGLMARMVPVTPRTPMAKPHMQDLYSVNVAGGHGELIDEQFYAGWIAYEGIPHRVTRTPNPALKALLDDFMGAGGAADLEAAMESALRAGGYIP